MSTAQDLALSTQDRNIHKMHEVFSDHVRVVLYLGWCLSRVMDAAHSFTLSVIICIIVDAEDFKVWPGAPTPMKRQSEAWDNGAGSRCQTCIF